MDNTWGKIRHVTQYHLKEVQDFVTHLKQLQSIMLEFNDSSPDEFYLIYFSRNKLRPLIKIQKENKIKDLYNWKNLVQKAIKAKLKAGLHSPSIIRKIDQQIAQDKQSIAKAFASFQKLLWKTLKLRNLGSRPTKKLN